MDWLQANWGFLLAITVACGSLLAQLLERFNGDRAKQKRQWQQDESDHQARLKELRKEYEGELSKQLDLKVRTIVELQSKVTKLEADFSAIERLYNQNILALRRANDENQDLKRRLGEYEKQIAENHREIESLKQRIKSLEQRNGSAEPNQSA